MERATAVRKPYNSTADLLTWSEVPPADSPATANASRSVARSHQPSDGISKVLFGGQITEEEAESLNKRKPCSGYKLKEITGSNIFAADGGDDAPDSATDVNPNNRPSVRIVQHGLSQISFSVDEDVSPKKPITLPEVAKQRELSGTLESELDMKIKKQLSNAKSKELSGNDIFGPPPEIRPRSSASAAARTLESKPIFSEDSEEPVMKTTKKIHNQKFAELTGNDIFKGDVPPGSTEKPLSVAKLKEMSGSNIFADGKAESRDYLGGVRKPPGGESSIALI